MIYKYVVDKIIKLEKIFVFFRLFLECMYVCINNCIIIYYCNSRRSIELL